MDKILEVKNLSFSYNETKIFEDVSFNINKGDYFGVIGSNGSGKSTLIKLFLDFLTPLEGEIKIAGHNVRNLPDWSNVGYISQRAISFNKSFPATVEEIIESNIFRKSGFSFINKNSKNQNKEKVYNALKIVNMEDSSNKLIGNLSGGQQQRVFIARMLVNEPKIVFLDEPTTGIDAKSEEAVYCLLAMLNKELGMTIVMVTHDISAITAHANKIGVAGNRKINIINTGDELSQELLEEVYGYKINVRIHKHECIDCCYNFTKKDNINNNMPISKHQ